MPIIRRIRIGINDEQDKPKWIAAAVNVSINIISVIPICVELGVESACGSAFFFAVPDPDLDRHLNRNPVLDGHQNDADPQH